MPSYPLSKLFGFTSNAQNGLPVPGDRVDIEVVQLIDAVNDLASKLDDLRAVGGGLKAGVVEEVNLSDGVLEAAVADYVAQAQVVVDGASAYAAACLANKQATDQTLADISGVVASTNASVSAATQRAEDALAYMHAAQVAAGQAETENNQSSISAGDAETAANSAIRAEDLAFKWAEYTAGPVMDDPNGDVDDGLFSSKWWANEAQRISDSIEVGDFITTSNYVSDATSDLEATVALAWNDYGTRNAVMRSGGGEFLYFLWPSVDGTTYLYTGQDKGPVWDTVVSDWAALGSADGASNFLQLDDTPENYVGAAGKLLTVNQAEDGIEYSAQLNIDNLADKTADEVITGLWSFNADVSFKGRFLVHENVAGDDTIGFIWADSNGINRGLIEYREPENLFYALARKADNTGWGDRFIFPESQTAYGANDVLNVTGADGRYPQKAADETISGTWTYTTDPVISNARQRWGGATLTAAINDTNTSLIDRYSWRFENIEAARIDPVGSGANTNLTVITREKGDTRYGQKGANNNWTGGNTFEGQTYCEDILNVGPIDSSGVARIRMWRAAGTEVLFDAMNANNTFTFRNNAAAGAITSARIEGAGTAVNNGFSVITREKGDARYGNLAGNNEWSQQNTFDALIRTRRANDTQIELGNGASRGSVHIGAYTTAGGGTWSMWGIGIGFGNSAGSRTYLNDGTGVNELKYRRQNGDISNIIHVNNMASNGVRGFVTSSDGNNTNYSIGTIVTARVGSTAPAVRATATIRISGGQFRTDVGSGSALAGTWRAMGQSANDSGDAKYCSFERVS